LDTVFINLTFYDCINDGNNNYFHEGDLKDPKGLANILIELTNAKEVIQQVTGEQGGFSFQHIRPGNWTVKIYENNFSAHHYLEKKEFLIELKPGEEKQITAKVLPTQRPI